ncbi:MAG TPA: non-canonical purine NTP pyrophosphatase [Candidatus Saccharimonadales bacterium]|nr:non-canonical purine NTP pyrophosphatase [Candidatus Saccharimonadales bacterium]
MNTILFATGNARKIAEAKRTLTPCGVAVKTIAIDIDEIQHHDPAEITKAKARAAYAALHQPVVVQDTSWNIPALGGFPGGYMKDVANWWQAEDWMNIMEPYDDRRIICLEHVAYFDGENLQHFEAQYEGVFVSEPRGNATNSNSLEQSICINGNETFAEMHDRGDLASAKEDCEHWELFAKWFVGNK